jgi:hypothetical protein
MPTRPGAGRRCSTRCRALGGPEALFAWDYDNEPDRYTMRGESTRCGTRPRSPRASASRAVAQRHPQDPRSAAGALSGPRRARPVRLPGAVHRRDDQRAAGAGGLGGRLGCGQEHPRALFPQVNFFFSIVAPGPTSVGRCGCPTSPWSAKWPWSATGGSRSRSPTRAPPCSPSRCR